MFYCKVGYSILCISQRWNIALHCTFKCMVSNGPTKVCLRPSPHEMAVSTSSGEAIPSCNVTKPSLVCSEGYGLKATACMCMITSWKNQGAAAEADAIEGQQLMWKGCEFEPHKDYSSFFFFKLNRSAKWEEAVDSNLAASGRCNHTTIHGQPCPLFLRPANRRVIYPRLLTQKLQHVNSYWCRLGSS